MKTADRIAQFIESQDISMNEFDKLIGTSNGYIGRQIRTKASIGSDILEKISCVFPDLDLGWLITGEGEMLKEEQPYKKTIVKTYATRDRGLYDELDALWQEVERLNKELKTCQQTASNLP